jgi:hypothetical protein
MLIPNFGVTAREFVTGFTGAAALISSATAQQAPPLARLACWRPRMMRNGWWRSPLFARVVVKLHFLAGGRGLPFDHLDDASVFVHQLTSPTTIVARRLAGRKP